MALLVACFVVVIVVSVGVGVLAHRRAWTVFGGPTAWGRAAAARFGPGPGAALVLVLGLAVTAVIGLGLGFLAKSLEGSVDKPTFHWVFPRVAGVDSTFTRGQGKLTLLGNNPTVQLVVLVSVIVLAFAYRRRWWLPIVGIAIAYFGEKYEQKFLAKVVDRGHPPTTAGTFPSGGVGRILAVYGAILILIILLQPGLSRAWRAGLWTGVVTGAVAESFTRIYLSKHWLTDAVFGLPFGALLLLTNVAMIAALAATGTGPSRAVPPGATAQTRPKQPA